MFILYTFRTLLASSLLFQAAVTVNGQQTTDVPMIDNNGSEGPLVEYTIIGSTTISTATAVVTQALVSSIVLPAFNFFPAFSTVTVFPTLSSSSVVEPSVTAPVFIGGNIANDIPTPVITLIANAPVWPTAAVGPVRTVTASFVTPTPSATFIGIENAVWPTPVVQISIPPLPMITLSIDQHQAWYTPTVAQEPQATWTLSEQQDQGWNTPWIGEDQTLPTWTLSDNWNTPVQSPPVVSSSDIPIMSGTSATLTVFDGTAMQCGTPADGGNYVGVNPKLLGFTDEQWIQEYAYADPSVIPWCGKQIQVEVNGHVGSFTIMDTCQPCDGEGCGDSTICAYPDVINFWNGNSMTLQSMVDDDFYQGAIDWQVTA